MLRTKICHGSSTGVKSLIAQTMFGGGWKNERWLNRISATEIITRHYTYYGVEPYRITREKQTPDHGWIDIFKSSGLRNAGKYKLSHTYTKKS